MIVVSRVEVFILNGSFQIIILATFVSIYSFKQVYCQLIKYFDKKGGLKNSSRW